MLFSIQVLLIQNALLFNFLQYDENMADIQTREAQKTVMPLWYSLCCYFQQLQTDMNVSLPLKVDDLRLLMSLYTKKAKPSSITSAATTATPR